MRIFLTGGSGYIGSAVLDAMVRGGHHVTCLVRNSERAAQVAAKGATPLTGDLADTASYRNVARDHDGIIHAAFESTARGVHVDETAIGTLVEAGRSAPGSRFLIYTSGVWVLGSTREPAAEDAPLNPAPNVAWRPSHEQAVLDGATPNFRTIVVRPGIVYGGSRGIIGDLMRDASNGLIRVIGKGENHWPTVYDRDLGDLYLRLATRPDASGLYHANDEGDERVNDIVEAIALQATHGKKPDVRHMPIEEARTKLGPYADALVLDQVVRSPRARALGWSPARRSVAANLPRLFEEWRAARATMHGLG